MFHLLFIAEVAGIMAARLPQRLAASEDRVQLLARLACGLVALALAPLGLIPLGEEDDTTYSSQPEWQQDLSSAMGLLLICGAAAYVLGLVRWDGGAAFWLRMAGWIGLAVALLIPSTLSLLLPIVPFLLITLSRVDGMEDDGGAWGGEVRSG